MQNPAVFKDPGDQSTWDGMPRVRSFSMNQAVGSEINGQSADGSHVIGHWLSGGNGSPPGGQPFRIYLKDGGITAPSPSDLWVLLDEHPNSINDAAFAVQMPINPARTYFIDVPAKYHNDACAFAFADGHAEIHKWLKPGVIPPVYWNASSASSIGNQLTSVPADPDVLWLARHTTAPAGGANVYYP